MENMVLLKLTFAAVLLTLIAVSALSFRLLFRKESKAYRNCCGSEIATESHSGGGCGCGSGCGCGGGDGK
jgi:uncharacterized membrane protein